MMYDDISGSQTVHVSARGNFAHYHSLLVHVSGLLLTLPKTPESTQMTQVNPIDRSQPKTHQDTPTDPIDPNNPKSAQSTQVNPSQPKSAQVNPSQPKSTQVLTLPLADVIVKVLTLSVSDVTSKVLTLRLENAI
ncbi:hypothetical protein DPMN_099469 [Dreissena polymorpha]|uniref:Uncharacterized protein n=1 Tax=Dreissena polymorpha TaxID=45954 RepID=A0A9D4R6K5_DREPO|nr:hypothetical protein DPMN_099469 [Dreissena polymorpha]